MDSINISNGMDTSVKEDNTNDINGRPTNIVSSQHPTMPLSPIRLDNMNIHDQHFDPSHPPRREEFSTPELSTPESTPPPSLPAVQEEKKTRWGLGRKIREKRDKK
jgi:hypothetical protein